MSYNKIEELIPKNTSELNKTIDHLNSHIDDIRPGASFTFDKEKHCIRYSQKTKDGQETLLIPVVATVKCDHIKDDTNLCRHTKEMARYNKRDTPIISEKLSFCLFRI